MRICELKQKEVINIHTCRSLGCPLDVEFCCETARLKALIMPEPGKFCWCFSRESECIIPGTASARLVKISSLLISVMKNGWEETEPTTFVKALYFYIFPGKVYFNRPLRIILMY